MRKYIYYFIILMFSVLFIHCQQDEIPLPEEIIPDEPTTPEMVTRYYVSTKGNDSNTGTGASKEKAWRTLTHAATKAVAGDTVYIEGGNYGNENVVIANAGSETSPIVFMGYNGTPVLDGGDYTKKGIYIYGKPYIIIKNICVKRYQYGIWVDNSHHTVLDGCIADSCCNTDYVNKGYDGYGILIKKSNYSTIMNCSATDNGGNNFFLSQTDNCTLENCKAYCKQTVNNQFITDYFVVLAWSSNNTVRNCHVEDINGSYKGNHGFIVKDNPGDNGGQPHSTGNLFINCTAKKFEECFSFAHGAYDNKVDNCYADNTGKNASFSFCVQIRDGAHSNTVANSKFKTTGKPGGIVSIYDGTEGSNPQVQANNVLSNCIFEGGLQSNTIGIFLRDSKNTTFTNCNFINIPYLFRFSSSSSGTDNNSEIILKNCILSVVNNQYDARSLSVPWGFNKTETGYDDMGDVSISYTNFWNGFERINGTGNIAVDPLFANETTGDYHLKSKEGRWDGTAWVTDNLTSLCINAGNPDDDYSKEPSPNGGRINMGAYGNTSEASKGSENASLPESTNKITFVTEKSVGETIRIALYATAENQADVWIDLNNNGVKDEGETPDFKYAASTGLSNYVIGKQHITIYGAVYRFDCYSNNRITALETTSSSLTHLFCHNNNIKGANMTSLMSSLFDRKGVSGGTLVIVDTTLPSEQNVALKSDVDIAIAKNWTVYDYKGSTANKVPYEGE
ncbi:MAG: right-handed parallel beta-helix repeat-containing protein [Petrimonas sp.]|jgi:parallel beta-helix repeat protein